MCFTEAQLNAIDERDAAAAAASAASAAALSAAKAKEAQAALKLREAQNTVVESNVTKTGDDDSDFDEDQPDATSPFVLGVGVVLLGAACSLGLASSMVQ